MAKTTPYFLLFFQNETVTCFKEKYEKTTGNNAIKFFVPFSLPPETKYYSE